MKGLVESSIHVDAVYLGFAKGISFHGICWYD